MSPWTPKPRAAVDWSSLDLTPQEAFVLTRVDGATDTEQLAQLSGLAPEDLGNVLARLVKEGVLEAAPPAAPTGPGDAGQATHRELFERTLHALEPDARSREVFTFHRPEELRLELGEAGLAVETVVGLEGPLWLMPGLAERLADPRVREQLMGLVRAVETEESFLGVSAHLLAVGRRPLA